MTVGSAVADNRPTRYEEDGRVVYRASGLGSCVKSLVALGLGMTPQDYPDWLYKKFDEGIAGEPVVIDMLRSNWRIMDENEGHYLKWHNGQLLVEISVGTRCIIRGHADAVGTCFKAPVLEYGETGWVAGERRLIEVKCSSEDYAREVIRELPMMYKVQISAYGWFFGFPIMLAIGIKDDEGKVVNVVTEMYDEPPMTMGQVKARVALIESHIARGELPNCDYHQYPCQFSWLCDEVIDAKDKPRTKDSELENKLEESIVRVRVSAQE